MTIETGCIKKLLDCSDLKKIKNLPKENIIFRLNTVDLRIESLKATAKECVTQEKTRKARKLTDKAEELQKFTQCKLFPLLLKTKHLMKIKNGQDIKQAQIDIAQRISFLAGAWLLMGDIKYYDEANKLDVWAKHNLRPQNNNPEIELINSIFQSGLYDVHWKDDFPSYLTQCETMLDKTAGIEQIDKALFVLLEQKEDVIDHMCEAFRNERMEGVPLRYKYLFWIKQIKSAREQEGSKL